MRTLVALLAAVLVIGGCGGTDTGTVSSSPDPGTESPASENVDVDITIKDDKVRPQGDRVDVKVGQRVTLRVSSDAAEEIHVHSDPDHTFAVKPGDAIEKSFTIDTPGQVAVEAHHLGVTVVQLVVRD